MIKLALRSSSWASIQRGFVRAPEETQRNEVRISKLVPQCNYVRPRTVSRNSEPDSDILMLVWNS